MGEVRTLLYRKPLSYEGLFRIDELYTMIGRFCNERFYIMAAYRNEEKLVSSGKDVFVELRPFRKYSDYLRAEMVVEIHFTHVKEKLVTVKGHKQKLEEGKVSILFSANMQTDWRDRWQDSGLMFFIRTLMDKYVRRDIVHQSEQKLLADCAVLQEEIRAYLNMHRHAVVDSTHRPAKSNH